MGPFKTTDTSETAFFFNLNRPSGHTKPMNPLTETASFSNRSPEWVKDDVTRDDLQRQFLTQHSITSLLQHCFESLQHCSNITTLCCAENRRCKSSRVTSPWGTATQFWVIKICRFQLSGIRLDGFYIFLLGRVKPDQLRWCYTGRFATAIFYASKRNNVPTIRNNVEMMCCIRNRRCKSSRVTPLEKGVLGVLHFAFMYVVLFDNSVL